MQLTKNLSAQLDYLRLDPGFVPNCATIRHGRRDDLTGTETFCNNVISLPFYTDMTDGKCCYVADLLANFFRS